MARIVTALGGNALGNTPDEQMNNVAVAASVIADLVESGNEVVITHGNGPQVGMINLGLASSAAAGLISSEMPFPECGAMSQGYIGYHLQNALGYEFSRREIKSTVLTIITRVEVNPDDPAFSKPSKPIGCFYSQQEMLQKKAGQPKLMFTEDSGRGWRRVVPSPMPVDIIEKDAIKAILAQEGITVISCGGGGIPVAKTGSGSYKGVEAVIDKDYASECLAEMLDADCLMILTSVNSVYLDFNTPNQKPLGVVSCGEAEEYMCQVQFGKGSMLPKVKAGVNFAASKPGRKAIICSLSNALEAWEGRDGTAIMQI